MRRAFSVSLTLFGIACGSGGSRPATEPAGEPAPTQPPTTPVPMDAGAYELEAPPSQTALVPASAEFDVFVTPEPKWRHQTSTPGVHKKAFVALTKRWSTKVGKTTFRTTMLRAGDTIVIGTHGATLNGKNEASDGIYVLDATTGKKKLFIHTPGKGDLDIGGTAVHGQSVFFTADNATLGAASLADGKLIWTAVARGKVRPAPALADLNQDGQVDVVAGDEEGVLYALDGKSGNALWTVTTGVNEYNARGFIAAAAIADIGGDGTDDVIAGARDGILTAYRGKDGHVLWQRQYDSGIHASPSVADFDQDGKPEVLAAWSYGQVVILDGRTGAPRWLTRLEQDSGGIEGLFGSPIPLAGAPGVLIAPTAWWGEKEDGIIGVGVSERAFRAYEGRMTASAVVTDLDGDGKGEAIIGTEKGKLLALTADGGYAVLATLGGSIEATALLTDTNGDSRYELLVASNDGMLTCFDTGSTAKPLVSRFRGEAPENRGDLGAVRLGWRASRGEPGSGSGE